MLARLFMAFSIAVLLSLIFLPVIGQWRRPSQTRELMLFFFVVVWLGTWGVGAWLPRVGPTAWGVPWLALALAGLMVSLLVAAASEASRARPRGVATALPIEGELEPRVFGTMFWAAAALLLLAALLGAVYNRQGAGEWFELRHAEFARSGSHPSQCAYLRPLRAVTPLLCLEASSIA